MLGPCSGLLSLYADTAALSRSNPSVAARDGLLASLASRKTMGIVTKLPKKDGVHNGRKVLDSLT